MSIMETSADFFPLVGLEKGYFLDVQHFFGEKRLYGFKVLCSPCNYNCYFCYRPFLNRKVKSISIEKVLEEMRKWEPFNIITFTGGEITLVAEATAKMMDIIRSKGVILLFSTNGFLTDKVDLLTKHADLVKIDIKGSRRIYKKVTGTNGYDNLTESIGICTSKIMTEVKILLHSFTTEKDILSILKDLKNTTDFPDNMIIEFQLIKDFLHKGIPEPDAEKFKEICKKVEPLPQTVLLKHYGEEEIIYKLIDKKWSVYKKKEVPQRVN